MAELTLEATVENLSQATEFVTEALEELDCPMKFVLQMELVVEELFVNVSSYAYRPNVGEVTICRSVDENPRALNLTFIDSGVEYNPLEHEDPDVNAGIEDREIGGLGIFLVKKNVDNIHYKRKDGKNILILKKLF